MGSVLDFHMQAALLACKKTPDREFREIAAEHGVDREDLQALWYDQEYLHLPAKTFQQGTRQHDAHHHFA